jgi:hypothetical protein
MYNQPRHDGFYCKTSLYYRGWTAAEISDLLGGADLLDNDFPPARYYRIDRVLAAEAHLPGYRRAITMMTAYQEGQPPSPTLRLRWHAWSRLRAGAA